MRCERAQELFSDYCDGSIQPAQAALLEGHLGSCADCRSQLEALRQVWQVLDSAPVVEPPAHFRALVWQRIEAAGQARQQAERRSRFAFDWRALFTRPALAWGAAALLVIVLAGVVVPGRYTAAKMWFPWNLIYRPDAPTWTVTVSAPRIEVIDGRRALTATLTTNATDSMEVVMQIEGGPTDRVGERQTLSVSADRPANLTLPLTEVTGAEPVVLRVTWQQNGQARSRTLTIPIR